MLDSIYHTTLILLRNQAFGVKHKNLSSFTLYNNERHYVTLLNL